MISFRAKIKIEGINPYVLIPNAVSRRFGIRRNIPVRAIINGKRFRATLTPAAKGGTNSIST